MKQEIVESLTIVIPALNEEDAIEGTIKHCLDARELIKSVAGLSAVEVIVVSDGSTDNTARIAQRFDEVHTIVFAENRGYGAAIKEGWQTGKCELLGFLDADGTCDPQYFAYMCKSVIEDRADVVLGSRLGPESKMPKLRRLGNQCYALLLGLLCGQYVTDTASGMRVVRRSVLKYLYPLPDGLHFTPSMSARALLNNLRVIEIPMRYEERIGSSKLSVIHDGVRFLKAIFAGVLCYRPEKILLFSFVLIVLAVLLIGLNPFEFYLSNKRVEEWMIYRFVVCSLLSSIGLLFLLSTALSNEMAQFGPRRLSTNSFWPGLVSSLLSGSIVTVLLIVLTVGSMWSLWPGIKEYLSHGTTSLHWSRLLVGSFGVLSIFQISVFALLLKVIQIWKFNAKNRSNEGIAITSELCMSPKTCLDD